MREPYDSDITREQFAQIAQDLEDAKKVTCPRKVDLYEVFCAILYLLKNACTFPFLTEYCIKRKRVERHPSDPAQMLSSLGKSPCINDGRIAKN